MKKKRSKVKPMLRIILLITLLTVGSYIVYKKYFESKIDNYNEDAIKAIKDNDIDLGVIDNKYSKTLEVALTSGKFINEYLMAYANIVYYEDNDFMDNINNLLAKSYKASEINVLYQKLGSDTIKKLVDKDYMDLSDYVDIKNFNLENYERYVSYASNKNLPTATVVTYVNIGLDKEFYSVYDTVKNAEDYLVLVNKYHRLPENYEPEDLVTVSGSYMLRKVAADAFKELASVANSAGFTLNPFSAYRSYGRQQVLYTGYVDRDGKDVADTYSARPGHSEHQTGLAIDVASPGYTMKLSDEAYAWVVDNSYKYGFIVRYPGGKIDITGYMHEDWHLRYIGVKHATAVHDLDLTYDEYYDLYIK